MLSRYGSASSCSGGQQHGAGFFQTVGHPARFPALERVGRIGFHVLKRGERLLLGSVEHGLGFRLRHRRQQHGSTRGCELVFGVFKQLVSLGQLAFGELLGDGLGSGRGFVLDTVIIDEPVSGLRVAQRARIGLSQGVGLPDVAVIGGAHTVQTSLVILWWYIPGLVLHRLSEELAVRFRGRELADRVLIQVTVRIMEKGPGSEKPGPFLT